MKKSLAIILVLVLCFAISACASEKPSGGNDCIDCEKPASGSYIYKAEAMQNAECIYYVPNSRVPNFPGSDKVQGEIMVWTQCPDCSNGHNSAIKIDPAELDFSSGDTTMYSDIDSCYDCYRRRLIKQFMWTIQITRTPA